MVNFLFGLLLGMVVGLGINACLRHLAMYFFANKVEKMLKDLEQKCMMSANLGAPQHQAQPPNPFGPRFN